MSGLLWSDVSQSMSETWSQQPPPPQQPSHHGATATLPEHPIPPSAVTENPLGCAVYGILLQPEPSGLQHPPLSASGGGEASPKCGVCGHDLSHLSNPQEHQCLQGGHDRSFQCTQCLKIFHQATDLLEHQCLQVEQKPFVCGVCKMGFSLLTSLAQHHSVHNGNTAVKCSICEKTYKAAAAAAHYKCMWCGERFLDLGLLQEHSAQHTSAEGTYTVAPCLP
ncbi:hypothetical protein Chor_013258 [Crotalus horridus]